MSGLDSSRVRSKNESAQVAKPTITAADLAIHNRPDDMWVAIDGKVFDVTKWANLHPGNHPIGLACLIRKAGKWYCFYYPRRRALAAEYCWSRCNFSLQCLSHRSIPSVLVKFQNFSGYAMSASNLILSPSLNPAPSAAMAFRLSRLSCSCCARTSYLSCSCRARTSCSCRARTSCSVDQQNLTDHGSGGRALRMLANLPTVATLERAPRSKLAQAFIELQVRLEHERDSHYLSRKGSSFFYTAPRICRAAPYWWPHTKSDAYPGTSFADRVACTGGSAAGTTGRDGGAIKNFLQLFDYH